MVHARFANLLKQAMGLDAASIGSSAIEHAVRGRLSACKLKDLHAYWDHVRISESELRELIEAVVVSETWFFRDCEALAALARMSREEWLPAHPQGVLRMLSLPCSTGEEPYSMAMALLDAGFPANRFRIDAIDISGRALRHAACAVYGKNSFRGGELAFRDRHFEATAHGCRLGDVVRQQVRFQQGNLLDPGFLPGMEIYDVIFCRNLLIYFDRATQDRAIQVLEHLLTARGVLFVAPAETGLLLSHGFVPEKMLPTRGFRRHDAVPLEMELKRAQPIRPRASRRRIAARAGPPGSSRPHSARPVATLRPRTPAEHLSQRKSAIDAAFGLADQGRLAEAERSCEEHLRSHGPSAQAFHLMGLIRDAAGDLPEAARYYRKALYLDQHHQEVLIHLACLREKQGDAAGARLLRNRIERLERKSAK